MGDYEDKNIIENEISKNNDMIYDYENKIVQLKNKNNELNVKLRKFGDYSNLHTGDKLIFKPIDKDLGNYQLVCMLIEYCNKYDIVVMKDCPEEDYYLGQNFGFRCLQVDTLIDEMKDYGFQLYESGTFKEIN